MSYSPFTFIKGYQERLQDFTSILSNNPTASKIQKEWSDHVELIVDPIGWKAIWKKSRSNCAELTIKFPHTIIVTVEQVNFKDLSCLVAVNEVEDDSIHLPKELADVPLVDLYPTKEQDSSTVLSLFDTAMVLDSLRFFYHHLWMPWDLEFDEDIPWVDAHLEGRLQLHFAIVERRVPGEVAHSIQQLMLQARHVQHMLEDLSDVEADVLPARLLHLTELHNKLCQLRNEYIIYEKPELLKALLEKRQSQERLQKSSEAFTTLVLPTTTVEQLSKLASLGTQLSPENNKLIRVVPSLQEALVQATAGACLWVTSGKHSLKGLVGLEDGGSISGLEPGAVIVEDPLAEGCGLPLAVLRGQLSLASLTIHMTSVWNIIKVWPGAECDIKDVSLEGSTITDGVDVFPGARFTATNCHFTSCRTALLGYPESVVSLVNCTFADNTVAIEVKEGCVFSMESCTIKDSLIYGLKLSMAAPNPAEVPTVKSINSIPQMKEANTVFQNNSSDVRFLPPVSREPIVQNGVNGKATKSD